MDLPATGHDPVLLAETLDALQVAPGKTIVDCTLGRGGHARAIAERLGPDGLLIGLDVDPRNLAFAQSRLEGVPCRVRLFHANFAELPDVLEVIGSDSNPEESDSDAKKSDSVPKKRGPAVRPLTGPLHVDGILADLGISTNQLFDQHYGLSFAQPMPLDMRVDPRIPRSAADLIAQMNETPLADLLFQLADERFSRRIARKIVEQRKLSPIVTTDRLADVVRSAIPSNRGGAPQKIDPATRTFLALRMAVNQEMENLEALLREAPKALASGGRFAVISFHSTEDRLVKQAFRTAEQVGQLQVLTSKPVIPSDRETALNPRSRSAKLRVAEKR
ncbi:16S rRNA (cytosine(1402)-N(4))-methyltransferase RsmH [Humisphaera borealis]|uniref:Ribosomal RNA small subunit methyltransferase H n=1 Tax=Humisphaera borealis TaxID=2807512 RepID=A0A7M2WWW4_9BACT|nr:16S rRNA (cytosine(1402)-N(4))-methyltransferase RsmH [Humisphaera borealis]QOV89000.1 16S rRNA (cytosine(1402)-N(4))-methyltransferase RsmH [Humisphaera borealis]